MFWAVKVQLRPHLCDIWAVGLTSLAVFMAVHTACYNALGPRLDLFNVRMYVCVSVVYVYLYSRVRPTDHTPPPNSKPIPNPKKNR